MRRMHVLISVVLVCLTTIGCGYALSGRGTFLPDYIETIGIPMFQNNSRGP